MVKYESEFSGAVIPKSCPDRVNSRYPSARGSTVSLETVIFPDLERRTDEID